MTQPTRRERTTISYDAPCTQQADDGWAKKVVIENIFEEPPACVPRNEFQSAKSMDGYAVEPSLDVSPRTPTPSGRKTQTNQNTQARSAPNHHDDAIDPFTHTSPCIHCLCCRSPQTIRRSQTKLAAGIALTRYIDWSYSTTAGRAT